MNYAAEWDAEHAKRAMFKDEPLAPVQAWFERWRDKEAPVVLDIGCGQGTNSIWLARMGFKVCGFDSSPTAVQRVLDTALSRRLQYRPRFVIADATKPWPYRNEAFDVAFDVRVLENLDADEEVLMAYSEIYRVIKPGGLFFCLTASEDRPAKYTATGKVRGSSERDMLNLLAVAGLQVNWMKREYQGTLEDWNVEARRGR